MSEAPQRWCEAPYCDKQLASWNTGNRCSTCTQRNRRVMLEDGPAVFVRDAQRRIDALRKRVAELEEALRENPRSTPRERELGREVVTLRETVYALHTELKPLRERVEHWRGVAAMRALEIARLEQRDEENDNG